MVVITRRRRGPVIFELDAIGCGINFEQEVRQLPELLVVVCLVLALGCCHGIVENEFLCSLEFR